MIPEGRLAHPKGSISERFFTFADPVRTCPRVAVRIRKSAFGQQHLEWGIHIRCFQGKFLLVNGNDLAHINLVQQWNGAKARLSLY